MESHAKSVLVFGVGFLGGWAARSVADSPQGVGVKLLEIALNTKDRLEHWAAAERERLEDMMAEARSGLEPETAHGNAPTKGSERRVRAMHEVS